VAVAAGLDAGGVGHVLADAIASCAEVGPVPSRCRVGRADSRLACCRLMSAVGDASSAADADTSAVVASGLDAGKPGIDLSA
jgi:hypothetical protein